MPARSVSPLKTLLTETKHLASRMEALSETVRSSATDPDRESFALLSVLDETGKRIAAAAERLSVTLTEMQQALSGEESAALDSYAFRLAEELRKRGERIEGDPANLILDGVVYVVFDRDRQRVTINGVAADDLRLPAVIAEVLSVRAKLRDGTTPPEAFIEDLLRAYEAETQATGKSVGDQVRLDSLHYRLLMHRQSKAFRSDPSASAFREYTRDQFRSDLYELLASNVTTAGGQAVAVDSGADTAGALWMLIPSLGRAGYVGRLRFTSVSR